MCRNHKFRLEKPEQINKKQVKMKGGLIVVSLTEG
jgi:hypothetical protein